MMRSFFKSIRAFVTCPSCDAPRRMESGSKHRTPAGLGPARGVDSLMRRSCQARAAVLVLKRFLAAGALDYQVLAVSVLWVLDVLAVSVGCSFLGFFQDLHGCQTRQTDGIHGTLTSSSCGAHVNNAFGALSLKQMELGLMRLSCELINAACKTLHKLLMSHSILIRFQFVQYHFPKLVCM